MDRIFFFWFNGWLKLSFVFFFLIVITVISAFSLVYPGREGEKHKSKREFQIKYVCTSGRPDHLVAQAGFQH